MADVSFRCTLCGNCCRGKGAVYVSLPEMEAIARFLGISLIDFQLQYALRKNGTWQLQSRGREEACVFLRDSKCMVYPIRPHQCRTWPFWKALLEDREIFLASQEYCYGLRELSWEEFHLASQKEEEKK